MSTTCNVDRNVNVNVEGGGCCNNGWDNDYHPSQQRLPVRRPSPVTSAVFGSMTRTVPANCVPVNYQGQVYQQCGGTWYQPQGIAVRRRSIHPTDRHCYGGSRSLIHSLSSV
jgi:hypothetical protein